MKKNNVLFLVLGIALSCNAMVAMNQPITPIYNNNDDNENHKINNQEKDDKRGEKRKTTTHKGKKIIKKVKKNDTQSKPSTASSSSSSTSSNKSEQKIEEKKIEEKQIEIAQDQFYNVLSFASIEKLCQNGLEVRNHDNSGLSAQTISINQKKDTEGFLIKIYDIKPKIKQADDNEFTLVNEYNSMGSKSYVKHTELGCGLHAFKNTIFLTQALLQSTDEKIKELILDMNNPAVFLHYLEGGTENTVTSEYSQKTWQKNG